MLIKNNTQGPISVVLPTKGADGKADQSAKCVVLVPGNNKLDQVDVKYVKAHPGLARMLEDGRLTITREESGNAEAAKKKDIAVELEGLNQDQAIKIIKETYNVELLESWSESESRAKPSKEIERQLKRLFDGTDDAEAS